MNSYESHQIRFTLPWLPMLPNHKRGAHWTKVRKEAQRIYHDVGWLALNAGLPSKPFERARIELVRHSPIEPDQDNLMASWKHVIDGIVQAGIVLDDSPAHVELMSRWERCTRLGGRKHDRCYCTITITEIA